MVSADSINKAATFTLCTSEGPKSAGINRVQWTLVAPMIAPAGRGGFGGGGGGGRGGNAGPPNTSCTGGGGGRGGFGGGGAGAIEAGTYNVSLTVNGKTVTKPVKVIEDVWMNEH